MSLSSRQESIGGLPSVNSKREDGLSKHFATADGVTINQIRERRTPRSESMWEVGCRWQHPPDSWNDCSSDVSKKGDGLGVTTRAEMGKARKELTGRKDTGLDETLYPKHWFCQGREHVCVISSIKGVPIMMASIRLIEMTENLKAKVVRLTESSPLTVFVGEEQDGILFTQPVRASAVKREWVKYSS